MSTNCDRCGYRGDEVKSGLAISEMDKRIILKVEDSEDLGLNDIKVDEEDAHAEATNRRRSVLVRRHTSYSICT